MSMIFNLLRVAKIELEEYLNDSSLLENYLYSEDNDSEITNLVDIDKSWDGIIFLLTGQNFVNATHPLIKVLSSGQCIDEDQDFGYGPAQYLTPVQVVEINNKISTITIADLKLKYDPKKMTELEVYPTIWENEGDSAFDYLSEYFLVVQKVYSKASKNGEAIITFIN